MQSFVASSTAAAATQAGKEVAVKIKEGISETKLVFVYGSCDYNTPELLAAITRELPGVPLVGNTSFTGIVTPEGFLGADGPFVGILALGGDDVTIGTAGSARTDEGPRAIGVRLARDAMAAAGKTTAPAYWYMAASPAEEEYYLKGVTEVIGRVPLFGGSAADNTITGNWLLYNGTDSFADGCVVAFFWTDTPFANAFSGDYNETADFGVVTKMDGDRGIAEIDGKPALEVYAAWRDIPVDELLDGDLLAKSVVSPLGVKDRLGDLVAIRHPMAGNPDHSIGVGAKVAEKTCVIRMEGDVDHLINSVTNVAETLKSRLTAKPTAYHFVHCGGRRAAIDARVDEVAQAFIKEAEGVPFIAEFTFGEYGHEDDGLNTIGGLMLSFTALG